ncbi:ferritin-like domain-containing protein [Sulfuricurvum sp.]|uniref:ferritin-like domain-containing protein n=1 Tax=Sulfuricurvum sp. TaxID=2025608 RepID=UPI0019872310|nr:ferritin-like domain-containing protein [Sulfuricurvum sp.]MBD3798369.1 ferritin-like domain-containing protein [Campylobacterota bacterium]MBD3805549.1 ferritin-like domain-containing protein [Sulfuricurvum sp.]
MELYQTLETILTTPTPDQKITLFKQFYPLYLDGKIERDPSYPRVVFDHPSYKDFCVLSDPKEVPRRTKLNTQRGQTLLLHAIAHIEYSAIDLALDAVYRFRGLGEGFERDWLEVADDEVRHFEMIVSLLRELGSFYGEYPVHDALFESSMRTLDLIERMAVVPRYLEANGLDATPLILKKLYPYRSDPMIAKIMAALRVILDEEIDHVRKGDVWFEYACERENKLKSCYFEIIEKHYPQSFPRKVDVNFTARKEAGFSAEELSKISLTLC